jgi:UDP-glucose 4-epimerase
MDWTTTGSVITGRQGRTNDGRTEAGVLVTGGAGFIGSHVSDAFLAAGVTKSGSWTTSRRGSGRTSPPAATFRELDIAEDGLEEVFREAGGFDLVSHHAAQIDVRKSVTTRPSTPGST